MIIRKKAPRPHDARSATSNFLILSELGTWWLHHGTLATVIIDLPACVTVSIWDGRAQGMRRSLQPN